MGFREDFRNWRKDRKEKWEKLSDEEKKQRISFRKFVIALVILLGEIFVFFFLLSSLILNFEEFFTPILDAFAKFIAFLGPLGEYIAGTLFNVFLIATFLISLILGILRMKSLSFDAVKAAVYYWAIMMAILDIVFGAFYVAVTYAPPDVLLYLRCITQPGLNCATRPQTEAPDVRKLGIYDVIDVKIGRAPKYETPPVYRDQTYVFKATVINKNPDKPLEDVYFDGLLDNEVCKEKDECTGLVASDYCNIQEKCQVEESQSATIESEGPVSYKSTFTKIVIKTHFSYSITGENKYTIFKNEDEAEKFEPEKPTSTDGPIDVAIDFAPDLQFLEAKSDKVKVLIYLENKGQGIAYVNSIKLTRSAETESLEFSGCKTGWGTEFGEDEEVDLGRKVLQKTFLFTCDYNLASGYSFESNKRTVPFTADVFYEYVLSEERVSSITALLA